MTLAGPAVSTIAAGTTVELSGALATMTFAGTHLEASLINNAGTLKIVGSHSFDLTHTLNNSGTLAGHGTVVGTVQNSGSVAPGTSPGTLTITGSYTQTSAGALQIELASLPSFDKLSISGTATLGGTLSVTRVGGFSPALGATFDILDWGSRTGTSQTVNLPSLGVGLGWNTSQHYTDGVLSVGPATPGDFNGDNDVDGADFVAWQTNFPTATGATRATGDADGDGDVDGADFVVWQTNFPFSPGAGVSPVPEPDGILLGALAGAIAIIFRRR
jgi:hypothetical protein